MLLEGIILKSVIQINEERTAANIYHLLNGKRSIQTVQDAHIYGLTSFFGIYKNLSRTAFDIKTEALIHTGHLIKYTDAENRTFLKHTPQGKKLLNKQDLHETLNYFGGLRFHEKATIFYQRLLLLIQTLTNTRQAYFSFIPVIDDNEIERWVKQFYKKIKGQEIKYLTKLEKELADLLNFFSKKEANLFVDRLSGYKHYGKSMTQLAEDYHMEYHDIMLLLTGISHKILHMIENDASRYSTCNILVTDLKEHIKLLESTKYTYKLFLENHSPEAIAQIRQLRLNTIYDHLTEIALYDPDFPFTQFVSSEEQQDIIEAIQKAESYKLKAIKEYAQPAISYFQIRLILVLHQKIMAGESSYGK